jgi:hypothetical protein
MLRLLALSALTALGARGGCILPCPDTAPASAVVALDGGTCSLGQQPSDYCYSVCPNLGGLIKNCVCMGNGGATGTMIQCEYAPVDRCGD